MLAKLGYHSLFPPQEEAIRKGLLEGKNIVVSAPTASGKTFIAELAILKKVLENNCKAIYLTPLRALASEKYEEFKKYEELNLKVALSTGDYDSSDPWLGEYDIIVATYEKMDSLLRHRAPWLLNVGIVILDEIHLLHDSKRGPTLEMIVARFKQLKDDIQFIGLSATIRNAHEIAGWLNAELIQSDWRPVPLKEGVYYDGDIFYSDGSVKYVGKIHDPVTSLTIDSLKENGQVLIFTNTRQSSVTLAKRLANYVRRFIDSELKSKLVKVANELLLLERNKVSELLAECVKRGVAFHHAGLSYNIRKIIENSFRNNLIKTIVATPTLAAGVNLPARRVIISSYRRYNAELGYFDVIPVLEYKQMAGRAGRPKYDKYGDSILIARTMEELDMLMEEYVRASPERIVSKLASEKCLRVHMLAAIASEYSNSIEQLRNLIKNTFYGYQFKEYCPEDQIVNALKFLKDSNMITVEENFTFKATPLGKRVAQLYIDPLSAVIILEGLKRKEKADEIGYLHLIVHTPDMPKLYLRRREEDLYEDFLEKVEDKLLINIEEYSGLYEKEILLSELKTAKLLLDWINEVPEEKIVEVYDVGPGDIHSITQTAEWLVYAASELAKVEGLFEHYRRLVILRERVKHGVKEELLELVRIKGIGRVRARILYKYGLKSLEELRKVPFERLVSIPGIGIETAKKIKEYLGEKVEGKIEVKKEPLRRTLTLEDFLK